uniref:Uncharacterized protein n=1 Tax=Leersia perrieri TaxID=77586 RepID=A0A0D9WHV5_9ORYZ
MQHRQEHKRHNLKNQKQHRNVQLDSELKLSSTDPAAARSHHNHNHVLFFYIVLVPLLCPAFSSPQRPPAPRHRQQSQRRGRRLDRRLRQKDVWCKTQWEEAWPRRTNREVVAKESGGIGGGERQR